MHAGRGGRCAGIGGFLVGDTRGIIVVVHRVELEVIGRALAETSGGDARVRAVVHDRARTDGVAGRIGGALRRLGPGIGGELAHHQDVVALRVLGPTQVDLAARMRTVDRGGLVGRVHDRADGDRQAGAAAVARKVGPAAAVSLVPEVGSIGAAVIHLHAPVPGADLVEHAGGAAPVLAGAIAVPIRGAPAAHVGVIVAQPQAGGAAIAVENAPGIETKGLAGVAQVNRAGRGFRRAAVGVARLRQVQGDGIRRHARGIIGIVLGVEGEVVGLARQQPGHFQAGAALTSGHHGLVAEGVIGAVGLTLRRAARGGRQRPGDQDVLAVPLRPAQIHARSRLGSILGGGKVGRRRQRIDLEVVRGRQGASRIRLPSVGGIIGIGIRDEAAGIIPRARPGELVLARCGLPPAVVPVLAGIRGVVPMPARAVLRLADARIDGKAGGVGVDGEIKLVGQPIAEIVGVDRRAALLQVRPQLRRGVFRLLAASQGRGLAVVDAQVRAAVRDGTPVGENLHVVGGVGRKPGHVHLGAAIAVDDIAAVAQIVAVAEVGVRIVQHAVGGIGHRCVAFADHDDRAIAIRPRGPGDAHGVGAHQGEDDVAGLARLGVERAVRGIGGADPVHGVAAIEVLGALAEASPLMREDAGRGPAFRQAVDHGICRRVIDRAAFVQGIPAVGGDVRAQDRIRLANRGRRRRGQGRCHRGRSDRPVHDNVVAAAVARTAAARRGLGIGVEPVGNRRGAIALGERPAVGLGGGKIRHRPVRPQGAGIAVNRASQRNHAVAGAGPLPLDGDVGDTEFIARSRRDRKLHVIVAGNGIGDGGRSPIGGIEPIAIGPVRQAGAAGNDTILQVGVLGVVGRRQLGAQQSGKIKRDDFRRRRRKACENSQAQRQARAPLHQGTSCFHVLTLFFLF